jgi:hypothetical protein
MQQKPKNESFLWNRDAKGLGGLEVDPPIGRRAYTGGSAGFSPLRMRLLSKPGRAFLLPMLTNGTTLLQKHNPDIPW